MKRTERNIFVYLVTYNRVNYLKLAIESILNQTFSNFSLTILDNCSTDNTEEYVQSIEDKRVHYIRHSRNIGGIGNIAYAFKHCEGDYFAVFHDDDVLHPTLLEEEIDYLDANDECVAVSCLANNIDDNGHYLLKRRDCKEKQRVFSGKQFFEEYLHNQRSFTFPATLYRTKFIKENKIIAKSSPGPCSDVVLYMDIEKAGGTISEIPHALIDYRIYKAQDSSSHLEEMLIKLIKYLYEDEYYSSLLMTDVIGRKKYLRWYWRRLLIREASMCIDYGEAKNYLDMMHTVLKKPAKFLQGYKLSLWIESKLLVPTNTAYKFLRKVKRRI